MFFTSHELKSFKGKRKLAFLTCYDYQMAQWMNDTSLDAVLVGDSLAQVIYGFNQTSDIGVKNLLLHTEAVRKGLPDIHLIGDIPYIHGVHMNELPITSPDQIMDKNNNNKTTPVSKTVEKSIVEIAKRFMTAGANSVKLENPRSEVVTALLEQNIPVCGHVGLTPQTTHEFKKQGKDVDSASAILLDAQRLDQLGCYALVLEAIPSDLAKNITEQVSCLTIGIAAGQSCDAQILVHYDLLGLTYQPKKFVTPKAQLGKELQKAIGTYIKDVASNY